jgi:hypothetical protein
MAPTFAEFLTWPTREEVILCELTPSLTVTGWTLQTGSTYKATLSRFDTAAGFSVYRRVVAVWQNATVLTAQTSIPNVDANPGSYWWDETNSLLYVRTTSGADPDTFTAMQAFVTFYCGSKGLVLNRTDGSPDTGIYYQPWVTADLPSAIFTIDDPVSGAKTAATAELALLNGHGFFHYAYRTYNWRSKKVKLFLGGDYNGQSLLRSQYTSCLTLVVENLAPNEDVCKFTLKPQLRLLDQSIPVTPFFTDAYPNLGEGVLGTRKWIGYGRATIAPDLTDTLTSYGVWTLADAAYQTLFAINAVYAIKRDDTEGPQGLTLGIHYTQDLTACTITITDPAYAWQDYRLSVDVTGKPDGGGSYYKTFSAITKDLLTTFLGVSSTDIDTTAFTNAAADAPQELSLWVKDPRSLASILATTEEDQPALERSVLGRILQTPAGLWTCSIFQPGGSAVASLRKEDLARFECIPVLDAIAPTVEIQYAHDHDADTWQSKTKTTSLVQYTAESTNLVVLKTFLRNASDAEVLCSRMARFLAVTPVTEEFEERGTLLATALPGDKVSVTYSPAPGVGGAFSATLFEIAELERSLRPALTISGRLVVNPLESSGVYGKWLTGAGAGHWGGGSPTQWY